ncbi:MAG: LysR family transcriptional regulator [Eubacterium sp.]|nr:LysR family transcriptional regulator [Eubacterium sp.]
MNFTRAAEKLLIPQPAVSKNISALEKELQIKLFSRDKNHSLQFTREGSLYYQLFSQFYIDFKSLNERTRYFLPPLKIGYQIGWDFSSFIPNIIKSCRMDNPMFSVTIENYDANELTSKLTDQSLDAILVIDSYPYDDSLISSEVITQIQQCIIYSDNLYPAPKSAIRSAQDLIMYPIYLLDDDNLFEAKENITRFCESYHFMPTIIPAPNSETIIANIDNGLGIGFYDELSRYINNSRIRSLPIDRFHKVSLRWLNKHKSKSLDLFKRNLIEQIHL